MDILYFGKYCDKNLYGEIQRKRNKPYMVAQYNYEEAVCLELNKQSNLTVVSIYQMESFPKDDLLFFRPKKSSNNIKFKYLKYINIPFIKEIMYIFGTIFTICGWTIKNRKKKDKHIFFNTHYFPVSMGIIFCSKIFRLNTIVTFTDLPLFTFSVERVKNMKIYKRIIIRPYIWMIEKLQEGYDKYILFSKDMNSVVNKHNMPSIVIEGALNIKNLDLHTVSRNKTIVHAGTLNKEVGIKMILDTFINSGVDKEGYELVFIGKGDMEEEIVTCAKKNSSVKYLGFMDKEELFNKLKSSCLLVNLRNPREEFTKYSFPSKYFEYLVSGTPVFSTKLEGIPNEYYNYMYTCDKYNSIDLGVKLKEILSLPKKELEMMGRNAQEFVLNDKTGAKQAQKIIKFIRGEI